jgi:hypothetical protein
MYYEIAGDCKPYKPTIQVCNNTSKMNQFLNEIALLHLDVYKRDQGTCKTILGFNDQFLIKDQV